MRSGKGNLSHREQIDAVLNSFDFDRTLRIMKSLRWKYSTPDGYHIPNLADLTQAAEGVLKSAIEHGRCSCGGFEAEYGKDFLSLKFVAVDAGYMHYEEENSWGVV